jgi:hypothetical protein
MREAVAIAERDNARLTERPNKQKFGGTEVAAT